MKKNSLFLLLGTIALLLALSCRQQPGAEAKPTTTVVIEDKGGFTKVISVVAQAVTPAVVHIDITETVKPQGLGASPFGTAPPSGLQGSKPQGVPVRALGSGVIYNEEGYIITNNHVVENANLIEVQLYDGTRRKAKIVGTDPATDLAVIKIDKVPGMHYVRFGDSTAVQVGEWVVAIGSPRGLDWTVTQGIISAKNRRDIGPQGPSGYEDYLQTDAAINPGNSGGPLINLQGEVIGINSMIVSSTKGSQGLGFAIPSGMVQEIAQSLIQHGKVIRGYLGVSVLSLTPEVIRSLKLPQDSRGVFVVEVLPLGPAGKAGVKAEDIITAMNGSGVTSGYQFRNLVSKSAPGSEAKISVLRKGKQLELTAKVQDLAKLSKQEIAQIGNLLLGVKVDPVTMDVARKFGLPQAAGVIITEVQPHGPAAQVGLEKGDIIFQVSGKNVSNQEQLGILIAEMARTGGAVLLIRDFTSGRIGYLMVPFA